MAAPNPSPPNETPPAPAPAPAPGTLRHLLEDESGAIILEYVILLLYVFLAVQATVAPLQAALMTFAGDVFEHLHGP